MGGVLSCCSILADNDFCVLFPLFGATVLDAGLLTGEVAEVVNLGAANFAVLVDHDRVNEGRLHGEDTLHADVVADLAHGETLL